MKRGIQLNGWQDFCELTLASWIIVSPFVLGYFDVVNASLSIILIGVAVMLFATLGLATENPMDEWVNFCLGAGLIASPWLFGFSTLFVATVNTVVCGGILVSLTILAMTHEYHEINEAKVAKETTTPT